MDLERWHSSRVKALAAKRDEFNPQDPHSRRKELAPTSWPLTSVYHCGTWTHIHSHRETHIRTLTHIQSIVKTSMETFLKTNFFKCFILCPFYFIYLFDGGAESHAGSTLSRPEDSLWEAFLSFYCVVSGCQTCPERYLPVEPSFPWLCFIFVKCLDLYKSCTIRKYKVHSRTPLT